jgi:predicted FMN-binding regulatory protein PaiB
MCKVILHCQPIAIVFSATPSYLTPLSWYDMDGENILIGC